MEKYTYTEQEALENIKVLEDEITRMDGQNRPLSNAELEVKNDILAEIRNIAAYYDEIKVPRPVTVPMNSGATGSFGRSAGKVYSLKSPSDKKDFNALFGQSGYRWEDKNSSFFDAVFSGRFHPGLIRNSMTETVPSDGGFLVPVEYSRQIHNVSLDSEIVMPRCFVQPMKSNECKIPAMAIGDHSSNLNGGFIASYVAETGTISEHSPKTC
jgi:HK97 family phage major capsid protein